jgi:predicted RNase H-like HicB family nuclease
MIRELEIKSKFKIETPVGSTRDEIKRNLAKALMEYLQDPQFVNSIKIQLEGEQEWNAW